MKARMLGVVSALALVAASPASAGIVYTLNSAVLTLGDETATGTITTDGNLGVLTTADILSVNITLNTILNTVNGLMNFTQTIASPNATFGVGGSSLVATSTALMWNFNGAPGDGFGFNSTITQGGTMPDLLLETQIPLHGNNDLIFDSRASDGRFNATPFATGDQVIASAVPGPIAGAGLPFLLLGWGAHWLRKRRRTKDYREAIAPAIG
jgi:hypothetical protein